MNSGVAVGVGVAGGVIRIGGFGVGFGVGVAGCGVGVAGCGVGVAGCGVGVAGCGVGVAGRGAGVAGGVSMTSWIIVTVSVVSREGAPRTGPVVGGTRRPVPFAG